MPLTCTDPSEIHDVTMGKGAAGIPSTTVSEKPSVFIINFAHTQYSPKSGKRRDISISSP